MYVPLIRTLQTCFPEAKLTWIISQPAYSLVEGMDGVEFIVINKPKSFGDYWRFKKALGGRVFDVLIASQASFRANLLYPLISAKRKIGYDKRRAKDFHSVFVNETIQPGREHTLEGFLKFAKALNVSETTLRWDLPINPEDYAFASEKLPSEGPVLLINPAASKPERSWPFDRYVAVIKAAQEKWQVKTVLTGGPGAHDRELANQILAEVPCIDLVGKTKPKQLLALISQVKAVLCPDTGPSHMATAVGTPVVALHAVTNAKVSGPYTFGHLVVNCYPEAMRSILMKDPETSTWGTQVHGHEAMQLIQVEAVMVQLEKLFCQAEQQAIELSYFNLSKC